MNEAVEEVDEAEEEEAEEEKIEAKEAEEEEVEEEEIKAEEAEEEEKEEVAEEIVEERIYTIPLRKAWISTRKKRAPRAARIVKSFVERHMKPETLVVSNEVNERIWSRGIEKPPRKIRVRAVRDKEGTVTLHLAEGD